MTRELFVPGTPVQQGSKQPGSLRETTGTRLQIWRQAIAWRVKAAGWHRSPMLSGPVAMRLRFVFPPLTSAPDRYWKVSTPDLDKLVRAVGDALKQGGAYKDDAQIAQIHASKHHGSEPGVHIALEPIEEPS